MYCCGSLYSVFIGETRTAVEEDNLFFCRCCSFLPRLSVKKTKTCRFVNIYNDDAGQNKHCIQEKKPERCGLLLAKWLWFYRIERLWTEFLKQSRRAVAGWDATKETRRVELFGPCWFLDPSGFWLFSTVTTRIKTKRKELQMHTFFVHFD